MNLKNSELHRDLKVLSLNITEPKLMLRLYELGIVPGFKIKILNMSCLKKTMLIKVLDSCFIIKASVAEMIEVEYA
ncbi:MAG: FeoA family protein [Clostridia bacterium]